MLTDATAGGETTLLKEATEDEIPGDEISAEEISAEIELTISKLNCCLFKPRREYLLLQ